MEIITYPYNRSCVSLGPIILGMTFVVSIYLNNDFCSQLHTDGNTFAIFKLFVLWFNLHLHKSMSKQNNLRILITKKYRFATNSGEIGMVLNV